MKKKTAKKENDAISKRQSIRELAVELAKVGDAKFAADHTEATVKKVRAFLADVAAEDGRVALGKALVLLDQAFSDAYETGAFKVAIDALKQRAELARLAEYADVDATNRAETSRRDDVVRGYLESTGIVEPGLKLEETARLVAQYVIDRVLAGKTKGKNV